MIGPPIDVFVQDMLEQVLFFECARRDVSPIGDASRAVEACLRNAFALGMQDERQLAVYIHNTTSETAGVQVRSRHYVRELRRGRGM
jgi:hypothetical protein